MFGRGGVFVLTSDRDRAIYRTENVERKGGLIPARVPAFGTMNGAATVGDIAACQFCHRATSPFIISPLTPMLHRRSDTI